MRITSTPHRQTIRASWRHTILASALLLVGLGLPALQRASAQAPERPADEAQAAKAVELEIASLVESRVVAIRAPLGVLVKKGEVVVSLDAAEHELRLQIARARIYAAEAELNLQAAAFDIAKKKRAIVESAMKRGKVTEIEALDAVLNAQAAEAGQAKARAALDIAKAQARMAELKLDRCDLRSPADGKVTGVEVGLGEPVVRGQVLLRIRSERR